MKSKIFHRAYTIFLRMIRFTGAVCFIVGICSLIIAMLSIFLFDPRMFESIGIFSYMLLVVSFIFFICESLVARYNT